MESYSTSHVIEKNGTLFIRDVTKLDCAVFDRSLGIVGHSWHLDVTINGALDENNFVYDFSELKSMVRTVMKGSVDHALLIPVMSQFVHFTDTPEGENWRLAVKSRAALPASEWRYTCPKGAVYPIRSVAISAAVIEQELARLLRHRLPSSILKISVKLRTEAAEPTAAFFRYTHGLAGHAGLCQRLFHGHRSRIEVVFGEERRPDLEHYVAREVLGGIVHIATPSQIKSGNIEIGMRGKPGDTVQLTYSGTLGKYEAIIPAEKVFVVEEETSIESIAQQFVRMLAASEQPHETIRVQVFEGIDKGAIAER